MERLFYIMLALGGLIGAWIGFQHGGIGGAILGAILGSGVGGVVGEWLPMAFGLLLIAAVILGFFWVVGALWNVGKP